MRKSARIDETNCRIHDDWHIGLGFRAFDCEVVQKASRHGGEYKVTLGLVPAGIFITIVRRDWASKALIEVPTKAFCNTRTLAKRELGL